MTKLPEPVRYVIDSLARLPGIGPRQATRIAFYLINRGSDTIAQLAGNLQKLTSIKVCESCFFIHQNNGGICDICSDPARKKDIIMIVEKETDLISLENTKSYDGRYLVIGTVPKIGTLEDWQKLRLQKLKNFIQKELNGQAEEIIIAFNPTSIGDFHASVIQKEIEPLVKKISRLGRGLPTGGEIEFADDETLGSALERRS